MADNDGGRSRSWESRVDESLGAFRQALQHLSNSDDAAAKSREAIHKKLDQLHKDIASGERSRDKEVAQLRQAVKSLQERDAAQEEEMKTRIRPAIAELRSTRNKALLILGAIAGLGGTAGAAASTFFEQIKRVLLP